MYREHDLRSPRRSFLIIGLPALLVVLGCRNAGGPLELDSTIPEGYSRILFSTSQTQRDQRLVPEGSAVEANEVFYLDVAAPSSSLSHRPLQGENAIDLPRGGVYIVGFANNPRLPDGNTRDISSAIGMVGCISIAELGLQTLPLSPDADQEIDLGALSTSGGGDYLATVAPAAAADGLGYRDALLAGFGLFDDTLRRYMNPDVDRNGTYDSEEGLAWGFGILYYFAMSFGNSDFDNRFMPFSPADLQPIVTKYIVSTVSGFPAFSQADWPDVRLYLPEGHGAFWRSTGDPVEYMKTNQADSRTIWFPQDYALSGSGDTVLGGIPFDGDYVLRIKASFYYLNRMHFLKPADQFENFTFPVFQLVVVDDSAVEVAWRWYVQRDGVFIEADPDLVRMLVCDFRVGFEKPGGGDTTEIAVPEGWNGESEIHPKVPVRGRHIGFHFKDIAGNDYYWMQTNGGEGMRATIEAFGLEERP